jgi:hypothetical protein
MEKSSGKTLVKKIINTKKIFCNNIVRNDDIFFNELSFSNLELRNAFKVFYSNLEDENLIEFQNVACYVLELLRIFNPDLDKRPEILFLFEHFVIQGKLANLFVF